MSKLKMEWMVELERFFIELSENWFESEYPYAYEVRSRQGVFSGALTIWLIIVQSVQSRKSIAGALEALCNGGADQHLSRSKSKRLAEGSLKQHGGSYSKARKRVPLEQVEGLASHVNEELNSRHKSKGLWKGKAAYAIDGTYFTLPRTKEILGKYPTHRNQHGEVHHPQLLCVCTHNVMSGISLTPQYGRSHGKNATSEQALAKKSLQELKPGGIVIGDRNFGVFSIAYSAQKHGHETLVRLTSSRAQSLLGREPKEKSIDEEVLWKASANDYAKNPEIPQNTTLKGRFIKRTVAERGFRPKELCFFTTSSELAIELSKLYFKRESIEHDIRSLKYTFGLEPIYSKSPDVIHKEIILTYLGYNLMRAVLAEATKKIGLMPRDISFSRAVELTIIFGTKLRNSSSPQDQKKILDQYLSVLRQIKHPKRTKKRVEPRKLVRKNKNQFPTMKLSREEERKLLFEN